MLSAGFEPAIPAINQLQTYAVYRKATGNGTLEANLHAFLTPALDGSVEFSGPPRTAYPQGKST
jgi:hypothetical protein